MNSSASSSRHPAAGVVVKARDEFKILPPVRRHTTGLIRGAILIAMVFGSIGALIGQRISS